MIIDFARFQVRFAAAELAGRCRMFKVQMLCQRLLVLEELIALFLIADDVAFAEHSVDR